MTSVDSNFNFLCGRPHGLDPLPVHMRPPEPDPPSPPCGRHKWMVPNHFIIHGWDCQLSPFDTNLFGTLCKYPFHQTLILPSHTRAYGIEMQTRASLIE